MAGAPHGEDEQDREREETLKAEQNGSVTGAVKAEQNVSVTVAVKAEQKWDSSSGQW